MNIYRIFTQILNMSLTASIVICVVLIARLLLKRAPKIFAYALWAVVLFRLLCPVSFSSEASLFNAFETSVTSDGRMEYAAFVPADTVSKIENQQPVISESNNSGNINTDIPLSGKEISKNCEITPRMIITYIWLGGISVMLIYSMISLAKLRRKLIGAVRMQDNIYLADHITSPFAIGLFRPKIYLPSSLSEQEQSYIIQHEQHHIKRRDHIVKIIAFTALCIHWFNPLVWLAFILAGNDMEMSCDEAVMKKMGNDIRADYSTSLLSLSTGRKMIAGTPLAFGEGNVKGRIKNVMSYKKPTFWVGILATICLIIVAVSLVFNPTTPYYDVAVNALTDYYERTYTEKEHVSDLELSFEQISCAEADGKITLTVNTQGSFRYPNVDVMSSFGETSIFEIKNYNGKYVITDWQMEVPNDDFDYLEDYLSTIGERIYKMKTSEEDSVFAPKLSIDIKNNFVFSYDSLSSYLPYGKCKKEGNILTAITDDKKYKYVFEIVDEDTLKFMKAELSSVRLIDEKLGVPIKDGAEFELIK